MKKSIVIAVLGITLISTSAKAETILNSSPETTINIKKITGLSSFCNAILKGDIQTVKSMISLGEDVNEKSLGMTPAIFAARYNRAEILEVLIENGADITVKCDRGRSIKKHAEQSGAIDALEVIEAHSKKK
ncbi:ankyrin repeat domain-containing protein [Cellulophaga baltica]|uniref:ankyrin repeat domain-containing protein n=1 Tax=Cellulophaga baltica TaxID=76594 RepID=UPI0024953B27|nr:ankyrin repeat domain-containing protein [Cellulophaga baltica]